MKRKNCLFAGLLLALAAPSFAQNLDNSGDEFLCGILRNFQLSEVELHLTSEVATSVTVEYPAINPTFTQSFNVTPGSITIVALPQQAASAWITDVIGNNMVHATAAEEFTCYIINRIGFSSDAALALPVDTMNREFILADWDPTFSGNTSEFVVYARFDDTTVLITPTADLVGGHTAGTPFSVNLDAGEAYYGVTTSLGAAGSYTGTLIEADRVVGVTNGTRCPNIPSTASACDHVFEVAQPVQTWGQDYVVANLPNRPGGSMYRVLAANDGTQILLDGVAAGTIDRGQFLQFDFLAGDHRFTSVGDTPFYAVQYMTGINSPGAISGDPAMGNVISAAQFKNGYTFSTVGGAQFSQHWLSVVCEDADVATILFDGGAIGAGAFTAIPGTGYSTAQFVIQEGTHTTTSTSGHGITVEGFNSADSYLYPGGALFQFINATGDANDPTCSGDRLADSFDGEARDDLATEDTNGNGVLDAGEDLNNNGVIDEDTGIFFIQLAPGSTNLDLNVAPFQPGDGVVTFDLTPTDSTLDATGGAVITDGVGNQTTCSVDFGGTIGTSVCFPEINSTGGRAFTTAQGSLAAVDNNLTLTTTGLPTNAPAFYFLSTQNGTVLLPGTKVGNLCILGPNMGRHNTSLLHSGAGDSVTMGVDLTSLPRARNGPTMVIAGDTWYWQLWYRDDAFAMGAGNFCDAIQLQFN